jgi:hypothetical protein
MPAPDRATIYNVEDAVEAACKAIIAASPDITIPAFMQREDSDLPDKRIDVQFRLGGSYGEREYAWEGVLKLDILTERTTSDPALHGTVRGILRDLIGRVPLGSREHPDFPEEVLPYHVINRMSHASTDPQCQLDDDLDVSSMRYDVIVSVRPGAFPA